MNQLLTLASKKITELKQRIRVLEAELKYGPTEVLDARRRIKELERQIGQMKAERDTPEVKDFLLGVVKEAEHQRARWGSAHDAGKTDADWYWLVGHLAAKALMLPDKRLHHLITTAAALMNWHLYTLGKTNMRPGIRTPP
jgi:hypothetical protein